MGNIPLMTQDLTAQRNVELETEAPGVDWPNTHQHELLTGFNYQENELSCR
jgi:hypothetical protein